MWARRKAGGFGEARDRDDDSDDEEEDEDEDEISVTLGWTPLMLAAQIGLEDVAEMLLGAKVNLEPRSPYRLTALKIAAENGQIEMVKLLRAHGAKGKDLLRRPGETRVTATD